MGMVFTGGQDGQWVWDGQGDDPTHPTFQSLDPTKNLDPAILAALQSSGSYTKDGITYENSAATPQGNGDAGTSQYPSGIVSYTSNSPGQTFQQYDASGQYAGDHTFNKDNWLKDLLVAGAGAFGISALGPALAGAGGAAGAAGAGIAADPAFAGTLAEAGMGGLTPAELAASGAATAGAGAGSSILTDPAFADTLAESGVGGLTPAEAAGASAGAGSNILNDPAFTDTLAEAGNDGLAPGEIAAPAGTSFNSSPGDYGPDPEPYDPSTMPTETGVPGTDPGIDPGDDFHPNTPGTPEGGGPAAPVTPGVPGTPTTPATPGTDWSSILSDPSKLISLLGGLASLGGAFGGSSTNPSYAGYTGSIPSLGAQRTQYAVDPNRTPGSAPQRYFSNTTYVPNGISTLTQSATPGLNYAQSVGAPAAPQAAAKKTRRMAPGGITSLQDHYLDGPGDGLSDSINATIEDKEPVKLARGEFVVSSDVVSALGNGSSDAGAQKLYGMMNRIRQQAHGKTQQQRPVNATKALPA